VRLMTIPDVDPDSFTYLNPPQGYLMRPSLLHFAPGGTVIVAQNGIAQITGGAGTKSQTSAPSTYNYLVTTVAGSPLAYETGMGPGHFDQPQNGGQLRDISPITCQINYQGASNTEPIGMLLPYDIEWESIWYVYTGYGWSQEAGAIIQYPMGQIPKGECASCMLIRPSLAAQATTGPGYFFVVRLNIPEKSSASDTQLAQTFLTNLAQGKVHICGLSTAAQGGAILRKGSTNSVYLTAGMGYPQQVPFNPSDASLAYPPFSETMLGATITLGNLTPFQKSQLLGINLPTNVGVLYDPTSRVEGSIMVSDQFYSYGMGGGPYYYSVCSPYLDISQMLGSFMNYVSMCNYTALTSSLLSQIQSVLAQTVINWVAAFFGKPLIVEESIATLLVLIGQGKTYELLNNFGIAGASSTYTIPNALSLLSPQGRALLKMFLYGPCSMTQVPVYYKAGSMSFAQMPGWPLSTVAL